MGRTLSWNRLDSISVLPQPAHHTVISPLYSHFILTYGLNCLVLSEAAERSNTLNDAGGLVVYEDREPALPLLLELAEEQFGEEGPVGSPEEGGGDPAGEEQPGGAGVSSEGGQLLYVVTAGSD